MLLRMLLVLIAVAGLSIGGCVKRQPTEPKAPTEEVEEAAGMAEEVAEDESM